MKNGWYNIPESHMLSLKASDILTSCPRKQCYRPTFETRRLKPRKARQFEIPMGMKLIFIIL